MLTLYMYSRVQYEFVVVVEEFEQRLFQCVFWPKPKSPCTQVVHNAQSPW